MSGLPVEPQICSEDIIELLMPGRLVNDTHTSKEFDYVLHTLHRLLEYLVEVCM